MQAKKRKPPTKRFILSAGFLGFMLLWVGQYIFPFGQDQLFYFLKGIIQSLQPGLPDTVYDQLTWNWTYVISLILISIGLILTGLYAHAWLKIRKETKRLFYGKPKKKKTRKRHKKKKARTPKKRYRSNR